MNAELESEARAAFLAAHGRGAGNDGTEMGWLVGWKGRGGAGGCATWKRKKQKETVRL